MTPGAQFLTADFIGKEVGAEAGAKREPQCFRTIWISDVYLGSTGCQAQRLLEFLRKAESDALYLAAHHRRLATEAPPVRGAGA